MMEYVCFFIGHKYFLAQRLSAQSRRVCCERCKKSFAMNDDCQSVLDWDAEFHELYESHGVKIKYLPEEFSR